MKTEQLTTLVESLPTSKTRFHYFKDRYAFMLLADAAGDGCTIAELKNGPLAGLLAKPVIKAFLGQCGSGTISADELRHAWLEPSLTYLATAGYWHGNKVSVWNQVTRPGANLVLRLHTPACVDRLLHKQIDGEEVFFGYDSHPVLWRGDRDYFRETLAWSRIDFDRDTGEAVIEELQSDWVRKLAAFERILAKHSGAAEVVYQGHRFNVNRARRYLKAVAPFLALWEEALLMLSIQFIREQLGINSVYMHEWASGNRLKSIDIGAPPRRLYTQLPRRFGFHETHGDPVFLRNDRRFRRRMRKLKGVNTWHRLDSGTGALAQKCRRRG